MSPNSAKAVWRKIRRKRLDLESWSAYEDRPMGASFGGAVPRPAPLAHLLPLFTLLERCCVRPPTSRVFVLNSHLALEISRHSPSLFERKWQTRLRYVLSLSTCASYPARLRGPLPTVTDSPPRPRLQTNGADALEETLGRLSKKPGVKATIALDRTSGAILKTAGQLSLVHISKSQQQQQQTQPEDPGAAATAPSDAVDSEAQGAEELARMVWGFVNAAGGLVEGLDTEVSAADTPLFSPPKTRTGSRQELLVCF